MRYIANSDIKAGAVLHLVEVSPELTYVGHQVECKHLNARVEGNERFGSLTCPDCHQEVPAGLVINAWLDELNRIKSLCRSEESSSDS